MEEQSSILLQKKMILLLSVIITVLLVSITYIEKNKNLRVAITSESIEIATVDEYFKRLVTVQSKEEIENDIILIEQVAYTAAEEIVETTENEIIEEIPQEVAEEPKTVEQETKIEYASYKDLAEDNPPTEYAKLLEVRATAYCLCKKCCGKLPSDPNYGITASGLKIIPGTGMKVIAVDTGIVPLGTEVYVEGLNGAWDYGYATAADTGSAIKNMKIDLYMDTHEESLVWGSRMVNLYVID